MDIKKEFDSVQNQLLHKIYEDVFIFSVKDKRSIYLNTRSFPNVTHDSLLVEYGLSVGEFAYACILADYIIRAKKCDE